MLPAVPVSRVLTVGLFVQGSRLTAAVTIYSWLTLANQTVLIACGVLWAI